MTISRRIPEAPQGDDENGMTTFSTLEDEEIDALLRGESASPGAGGLAELIRVLQVDVVHHGAPPMSRALRTQVARRTAAATTTRRRRILVGGLGSLVFGGAAMGVAGAQDVLPAPIQDATASVADVLGVELPRSTERDAPSDDGSEDDGDGGSGRPTDTTTGGADSAPLGGGSTETTPAEGPSTAPGPPDSTPGGAVPADPGTPGDKERATPATPATGNGQGSGQGNANGNGNKGSETGPGAAKP